MMSNIWGHNLVHHSFVHWHFYINLSGLLLGIVIKQTFFFSNDTIVRTQWIKRKEFNSKHTFLNSKRYASGNELLGIRMSVEYLFRTK